MRRHKSSVLEENAEEEDKKKDIHFKGNRLLVIMELLRGIKDE